MSIYDLGEGTTWTEIRWFCSHQSPKEILVGYTLENEDSIEAIKSICMDCYNEAKTQELAKAIKAA